MPIVREWYAEDCVLVLRIIGELTLTEMYNHDAITEALMQQTCAPVYVLVDTTQVTEFPMSLNDHFALWGRRLNPKISLLVLYGIQLPLAGLLANIVSRVSQGRCQIVSCEDDAVTLIQRHRQTGSVRTASLPSFLYPHAAALSSSGHSSEPQQ